MRQVPDWVSIDARISEYSESARVSQYRNAEK